MFKEGGVVYTHILTLQYKAVVQEPLYRFKEGEGVLFKEGGGVYTHSPV